MVEHEDKTLYIYSVKEGFVMRKSENENKVVTRQHLAARIGSAMVLGGLLLPAATSLTSNTALASSFQSQGAKAANLIAWDRDNHDDFDGFNGFNNGFNGFPDGFGHRIICTPRRHDNFDRFELFDRFDRDHDHDAKDDGKHGDKHEDRRDDRRFDRREDLDCKEVNVFVVVHNKQEVKVDKKHKDNNDD